MIDQKVAIIPVTVQLKIPVNGTLSGVNIAAEAHACPGPHGYCQQRMRDIVVPRACSGIG